MTRSVKITLKVPVTLVTFEMYTKFHILRLFCKYLNKTFHKHINIEIILEITITTN